MPILPRSSFRRLDLDLSPVEVAGGLRHLPGMVFLDSAVVGQGAISVIGACPARIVADNLPLLRSELEKRQTDTGDLGFPTDAAIGFFEYEGSFCFGFYDELLVFDHSQERWLGSEALAAEIQKFTPQPPRPLQFEPLFGKERFCSMVRRAQEYIAAGDIYQVNLAQPFQARWDGDAFTFFEALRHYSPAPFSAFIDLGGKQIISSSPECFLKMSGRHILTRPIKGTRPRYRDQARDEHSAYELLTSVKEIAELVMITDLERNDLGQICEFGSVHVSELLKMERFEQVFHLVSTVEGRLGPQFSHLDALLACFPGGSITGAPKKRARQIISELEQRPRGVYTGAIGYFGNGGKSGESQFSIVIRTAVKTGNQIEFQVGAGIVADSIPEAEYQETLDKAAGMLLAAERLHAATA
ncbi:MAG TPA: anthranilate synthase component I family protein [Chthoniobacterales bacterium]